MQKNLVIVESPAKAKTIEKFLGSDYKVLSSYGHIRDLKKRSFSIDIDKDFAPTYEIPADKKEVVKKLKEEAAKAQTVWLASDEDREGEAISWHLFEVLGLDPAKTKRIVFHEITKNAILKAIENPRDINMDLVNAQQARRVLDRIVGFELSPVLWKKVKPALSAGRVQSVAVRLIVEREREVTHFKSEAAYKVTALFTVADKDGKSAILKADLDQRLKTKAEAEALLERCKDATFTIDNISVRPGKKSPAAPFTTSTLQQEAARKLGYTVSQTMVLAQRLYEAGLITYMRTDSVNLSEYAIAGCKKTITDMMGERYAQSRHFTTRTKGAQEAHEAIRPTYMENESVNAPAQEKRLYDLIWKRTLASQMADAETEKTTVSIVANGGKDTFTAVGEVVKFDGFLRIYKESYDDESVDQDDESLLPPLTQGEELSCRSISATERFTQRPARYTEASLVKKLEELGIGRPSTYAPTISTIQQREYVVKGDKPGEERSYNVLTMAAGKLTDETKTETVGNEKSKLLPTDIGIVVNDFLTEYFPNILDYNFTANIEKEFDEIADGEKQWNSTMSEFYKGFHPSVESTLAIKSEHKVGERILGEEPKTGEPVAVKIGRFGPMIQIGRIDSEQKPRFARLPKELSMETITLEQALELFKLPRTIGEFEDEEVSVAAGRFGPYVKHNNKFYSLTKDMDPMAITLDDAIALINAKREAQAKKFIKQFDEDPEMQILNGRYGPYISYQKKNYKIPEGIEPSDLSLQSCHDIIKLQSEKESAPKKRRYTAKKKA